MISLISFILSQANAQSSNTAETIVVAVLSSSVVGGVIAMFTKRLSSPESENDLARLGNEFAHQMLEEARTERNELRLTIRDLEHAATDSKQAIERLRALLHEKDLKIQDLENVLLRLTQKLQKGEPISLRDIFGEKAPDDVHVATSHHDETV